MEETAKNDPSSGFSECKGRRHDSTYYYCRVCACDFSSTMVRGNRVTSPSSAATQAVGMYMFPHPVLLASLGTAA